MNKLEVISLTLVDFGEDPLVNNAILSHQHEAEFHQRYPNFEPFFNKLVNGFL